MTRIVAGIAGGRTLKVPPRGTRPTSDRVREALFSSLDSRLDLDGAAVLDLYAGSGALGLEALSRGASTVVMVESDARAAEVIRGNAAGIGLPGASVRCAPVSAVLASQADRPYDLVLADPPYAIADSAVAQMLVELLTNGWLAPESLVVLERSSRSAETTWPEGLVAEKVKKYGETRIEIAGLAR
ncbi:16S rRNA (guanine(966)-N(2))-methyltransferase RsmD [Rhodococcus sp. BP22]|uniref:16S rRNA (guanine(966)-N(2))-methyltransferase RsmD n=1 Tax=Rhodococcus sp. BP22 TaxID=2758566 RepID=UPI0016474AC5|nr:16S rRNA (guanine(966)-N(2))-methyltransferase RsmD [Rhodococcus sp. BP22]